MAQNGQETATIDEKCRTILRQLYDGRQLSDFDKTEKLLAEFRVLSREKTINASVLDEQCLRTLVDLASRNQIEAQKCLSNLILNYAQLRQLLIEPYVGCVEHRLEEILKQQDKELLNKQKHCEVLYYDLRIVFLLSALCSGSRVSIRNRLLSRLLQVTLLEAEQFCQENYLLVIESLKTLFNLTMDKCVDTSLAAKVINKLFSLHDTEKLRKIELQDATELDHTDKLLVNLIHLLTNMPKEVYLELSDEDVDKILNHLEEQLRTYTKASFRDTILPVLNTCANICRHNESVRLRWFDKIIGSTKEFDKRPEEYDTLRGRLVKLMTSVDIHIKEIAAEFLYALCGGDTEKFITYTGFGNSAAYLSTKGLLSSHKSQQDAGETSASSTDDKYLEIRSKLDPITGKIGQPKKNPMEGMSEEEKEWHAHELAGAIAKLSNLGIKPMQIGPDGETTELRPKESDNREHHGEDSKFSGD